MSDYKLVRQDIRTASGVLAYTRGQKIHVDAVKANGWDDYVTGEDTAEARAILAEITGEAFDEPPEPKSTKNIAKASGDAKQSA